MGNRPAAVAAIKIAALSGVRSATCDQAGRLFVHAVNAPYAEIEHLTRRIEVVEVARWVERPASPMFREVAGLFIITDRDANRTSDRTPEAWVAHHRFAAPVIFNVEVEGKRGVIFGSEEDAAVFDKARAG